MKNEKSSKTTSSSNGAPPRSPYDLLLQQSKKLGAVATKSYDNLKDFLNQDIVLPQASQLLQPFAPRTRENDIASLKKEVKKTHQILARARSVFPLTLFPDTIILDRSKITIIKRNFFWQEDVVSIQVEDVLNVNISVGPFFGSLNIASRVMNSVDHFQINNLWRNDAIMFKQMIQGYVIAKNNHLDTNQLSRSEMVEMLTELGHDFDL